MPFVKLDCGILDSSLWIDRECREVFVTALLMAIPHELKEPTEQLAARGPMGSTGWTVPAGWYGFVEAAGAGIVRRAGLDQESGLAALARLGEPEEGSRSPDHDGRRLVRVDGGYIVLNFFKYRDRDYTGAERAKRYRERKAEKMRRTAGDSGGQRGTSHRDVTASHRDITQAEAEAEAEAYKNSEKRKKPPAARASALPPDFELTLDRKAYAEKTLLNVDAAELMAAFRDYHASKGTTAKDWDAAWRTYVRNGLKFGYPMPIPSRSPPAQIVRIDPNGRVING